MADIILIPGLWLDGDSWSQVVPALEEAGHRAHPITLPGMQSRTADRAGIGLADTVAAVVEAIDRCDGPVVLVGHSAGSGIAYGALDARPEKVSTIMYVGGFPSADGEQLVGGLPAVDGEIPLPQWDTFDEADLRDLDDALRASFRARAIPSPERVCTDPVRLSDERRLAVPAVAICPEYDAEQLRSWVAAGDLPELARAKNLTYVDVPTGHWPQFTKPRELAAAIAEHAG